MPRNAKVAALRQMLHRMETEIGLDALSPVQRDVYYAASLLNKDQGSFATLALQEHPLVQHISRPTFFRALRYLQDEKFIAPLKGAPKGTYCIEARKI